MEIKKLQADFKWLKSNVENEALMGSGDREEKPVTDEQVASHMLKVQDQDKDLLRQGLNKVNEATKVADVIVQQLDEQTEQLQRINKKSLRFAVGHKACRENFIRVSKKDDARQSYRDSFTGSCTWNCRYRYLCNNKSRPTIIRCT